MKSIGKKRKVESATAAKSSKGIENRDQLMDQLK